MFILSVCWRGMYICVVMWPNFNENIQFKPVVVRVVKAFTLSFKERYCISGYQFFWNHIKLLKIPKHNIKRVAYWNVIWHCFWLLDFFLAVLISINIHQPFKTAAVPALATPLSGFWLCHSHLKTILPLDILFLSLRILLPPIELLS